MRYKHGYRNKRVKKKEDKRENVNKDYLKTHKNITIRMEMDEMRSFYHDKKHQIWLWRAIGHETGEAIAFWFGAREQGNLDKLLELLKPLAIEKAYADGNYAYYKRFSPEVLTVTKKNTQKRERKHLSLRAWSARLARKGIRFSKTEQMHKIVAALAINIWFFGRLCLIL
jgi:insertion element IS1 protein InsB